MGKLSPIATFGPDDPRDDSDVPEAHDHVVLLQSMFQVTDSRRSYKSFLYATLEHLFVMVGEPEAPAFIDFLANLADSRYRTNIEPGKLH